MSNPNKRSLEEEQDNNINKAARNDEEEEEEQEEQKEEQKEEEQKEENSLVISNPISTIKYKIPGFIITGTYTSNKNTVQEDPLPTEEYKFNIRNKNITLHGAPEDSSTRYLLVGKTEPRENRSGKFVSTFTYFYPNKNKLERMDKKLAEVSASSSSQQENTDYDEAAINFLVRSMRNTSLTNFDEQFENSTRLGGNKRKSRKNRKSRNNRKSRKSRKNRKSRKSRKH